MVCRMMMFRVRCATVRRGMMSPRNGNRSTFNFVNGDCALASTTLGPMSLDCRRRPSFNNGYGNVRNTGWLIAVYGAHAAFTLGMMGRPSGCTRLPRPGVRVIGQGNGP